MTIARRSHVCSLFEDIAVVYVLCAARTTAARDALSSRELRLVTDESYNYIEARCVNERCPVGELGFEVTIRPGQAMCSGFVCPSCSMPVTIEEILNNVDEEDEELTEAWKRRLSEKTSVS
jgi:hypothetical protein